MKIVNIVGARPQFIKVAMVSRAIKDHNRRISISKSNLGNGRVEFLDTNSKSKFITEILIHTGQHYDFNMSNIFFQELNLPEIAYNLGIGSGTHGEQTGRMLVEIEKVLMKEKPDVVLVYGDTNSTLAGAIASVKLHIPVAHVEAGLRSYNMNMPEEVNRILTDHCSTILFCPTRSAVENLKKEGFINIVNNGDLIPLDRTNEYKSLKPFVLNVGDVMYDLLLYALPLAERSDILERLSLVPQSYRLVTLHRAENVDNPYKLKELLDFASKIDSKKVIFPVHPRTKNTLSGLVALPKNLLTIEPLGYIDMLKLIKCASVVMTDSGGVQKEAFWLKVPCITLRDETEWIETVESGWNVLYKEYCGNHHLKDVNLSCYGDGNSAERIIRVILDSLEGS